MQQFRTAATGVAAVFLCRIAVGTASPAAIAQTASPASASNTFTPPQVAFETYTLSNGLRVILARDPVAPVVSLAITYNVGSRDEKPGKSGFAHLFEHMMFQGSENVGKGEHFIAINGTGGTFNGTTTQDRTNYFATVPANQLDMILFLEADRMRSLDVSQTNLDNQREVVKEEKRQRIDNQALGGVYEAILKTGYSDFPYQHTTIGTMEDLNAASLDDVRSFFKTYYAPNNAVLALSGDFDPKTAKQLIEKRFGKIPYQPAPPPVVMKEPLHTGERRTTLSDSLATSGEYVLDYLTVSGDHADYYPLYVLGVILSRGESSRFYKALVEPRIALSAAAFESESRGPGLFNITVPLRKTTSAEQVAKIIDDTIAQVQKDGITDDELTRAKRLALVASVARLQSNQAKAVNLSAYAVYFNDPGRVNSWLPRIQSVTKADVLRVAREYLTVDNRAVIDVKATASETGEKKGDQ